MDRRTVMTKLFVTSLRPLKERKYCDYSLINLGNDQLDTKLLYFIICLLQSFTRFEQRHANHQEVKLY